MTNERIKTIKINKKKILSRLRKKTKSMMISSLSSEDPWCNDFLADCCNCCPGECPTDCSQCDNSYLVSITGTSVDIINDDHIVNRFGGSSSCSWFKFVGGDLDWNIQLNCVTNGPTGSGWIVRAENSETQLIVTNPQGFSNCPPLGDYGSFNAIGGSVTVSEIT